MKTKLLSRKFLPGVMLMLLAAVFGLGAFGYAQESVSSAQSASTYRIGPSDILQISVWKNETLSRTVPVRPDGKVSLPLVHEVQAAGLTPAQLRDVLKKKLAAFIANPEVSVTVQEVHSFSVSVLGEVKTAGRYELKRSTTVLDVLALAGGVTEFAARSRIFVLRPEGDTVRRIPFNYNKVVATANGQDNFVVQPGDVVVVP